MHTPKSAFQRSQKLAYVGLYITVFSRFLKFEVKGVGFCFWEFYCIHFVSNHAMHLFSKPIYLVRTLPKKYLQLLSKF